MIEKLKSGFVFVLGFLLSPFCWWNDLIVNLPIALICGKALSLISSHWFAIGAIGGYWLSNLLGIGLMQLGAVQFFKDSSKERNPKKDLLIGLASSTVYTFIVLGIIRFNLFDASALASSFF